MSPSKKSFEFTEHGAFETNAAGFFTYMGQEDAALAAELQSHFKALPQSTNNQPDILNSLFSAAEKPSPPKSVAASTAAAGQGATATAPASATGWLLEGLSIEGFRGINNQGTEVSCRQS